MWLYLFAYCVVPIRAFSKLLLHGAASNAWRGAAPDRPRQHGAARFNQTGALDRIRNIAAVIEDDGVIPLILVRIAGFRKDDSPAHDVREHIGLTPGLHR